MTRQVMMHEPGDHVYVMTDRGTIRAYTFQADGSLQECDAAWALHSDRQTPSTPAVPPVGDPAWPAYRRVGAGTPEDPARILEYWVTGPGSGPIDWHPAPPDLENLPTVSVEDAVAATPPLPRCAEHDQPNEHKEN